MTVLETADSVTRSLTTDVTLATAPVSLIAHRSRAAGVIEVGCRTTRAETHSPGRTTTGRTFGVASRNVGGPRDSRIGVGDGLERGRCCERVSSASSTGLDECPGVANVSIDNGA